MRKILGFLLILVFASLAFAHLGEEDYGHHSMMLEGYGYGMMFFGWFFVVLVFMALVLLIAWLIKQLQKG